MIRCNDLALSLEQRATYEETSSLLQMPRCFADSRGCAKATPDVLWIPGDKRQPDSNGGDSKVPDCIPPYIQQPLTGNNQQYLELPRWNSSSSMPQGLCGHAVGNTRWMRRAPHCHVPRTQLGSENEAALHFTLLKVTEQLQYSLSKIFHIRNSYWYFQELTF